MKIDRLIGIITVLQQNKKVTAPYLADKFEVSRRTINRDIEDICRSGIPIVTMQGADGGISIMDGFNLDTTVFTIEELQAIFIGLKSVDSVLKSGKATELAKKFGGDSVMSLADNMIIDLSSFYKDSLSEKIDLLKTAIYQHKFVSFHYYYNKGESDKLIEPYLIVFKWSDWYIFGFCKERQDFRMYKLRRLWNLKTTDENFTFREISKEKKQFGSHMTDDYFVTAIYEASEKYKLVEEYGPHSFTVMEDGRLYTKWGFTDPDNTVLWFLGFGDKVEIIEPNEMREKIKIASKNILNKYK